MNLKKVKDFPNYEVSDCGKVFSLNNKFTGEAKQLKTQERKDGTIILKLYKEGFFYIKRVQDLVAEAFLPNPDNKPRAFHIDLDKTNNHVSNLKWMTKAEAEANGNINVRGISNSGNYARDHLRLYQQLYRYKKQHGIDVNLSAVLGYAEEQGYTFKNTTLKKQNHELTCETLIGMYLDSQKGT